MKTIILSAMAALLSTGAANANNLSANSTKKASAVVSNHMATYSELLAENNVLKLRVSELEEMGEETQSQLQFERMMSATLSNLKTQAANEKMDELNAGLQYSKTMSAVLVNLASAK